MKFQTLSVVAGTQHCDAACPFCVSGMTGLDLAGKKPEQINYRNMKKTLQIAEQATVQTAIITGKGEPTMFPDQVSEYLDYFNNQFPFVELQTNGIKIANRKVSDSYLKYWYDFGLTTILISNVGFDQELNRKTYMPKHDQYLNTQELIERLHSFGFLVRMTCVGIKDGIDSADKFQRYMEYCHMIGADQITWRPLSKPDSRDNSESPAIFDWTVDNSVTKTQADNVRSWVKSNGVLIRKLAHGGAVFDIEGKNVCITDCLTHNPDEEELRQLIYFPSGELYTDWQYRGSRLL